MQLAPITPLYVKHCRTHPHEYGSLRPKWMSRGGAADEVHFKRLSTSRHLVETRVVADIRSAMTPIGDAYQNPASEISITRRERILVAATVMLSSRRLQLPSDHQISRIGLRIPLALVTPITPW